VVSEEAVSSFRVAFSSDLRFTEVKRGGRDGRVDHDAHSCTGKKVSVLEREQGGRKEGENVPTIVNIPAEIFPTRSPKFKSPTARPPRTTVKLHKRGVSASWRCRWGEEGREDVLEPREEGTLIGEENFRFLLRPRRSQREKKKREEQHGQPPNRSFRLKGREKRTTRTGRAMRLF
jgi:hypothetical protein